MRRLAPQSRRGQDDGLSLAEMIISMAMASIIMISLGTLFVSSLRQNKTVTAKTNTTADARIAMEAMTRELRVAAIPKGGAAAVTTATSTSITFYSSIGVSTAMTDPNPSLVTLSVDNTKHCLWREITPATVVGSTLTWPTSNKRASCVARGDINLSGAALFTYYPLAADDTVSTTPFATSAVASNLARIAGIGLALEVTDNRYPAVRPTVLQDQVTLINIATALGS